MNLHLKAKANSQKPLSHSHCSEYERCVLINSAGGAALLSDRQHPLLFKTKTGGPVQEITVTEEMENIPSLPDFLHLTYSNSIITESGMINYFLGVCLGSCSMFTLGIGLQRKMFHGLFFFLIQTKSSVLITCL